MLQNLMQLQQNLFLPGARCVKACFSSRTRARKILRSGDVKDKFQKPGTSGRAVKRFLDPKSDIAFKRIFGTEKNKEILLHFLNDVMALNEKEVIKDIQYVSPIQQPELAYKKLSILDILCKDKTGAEYLFEMQVAKKDDFLNRTAHYASKAYTMQLDSGGQYSELKETISISILDFVIFPQNEEFISFHTIKDGKNQRHMKSFQYIFIELPKFKKTKLQLESIMEKWVYFFKKARETSYADVDLISGKDHIIRKAFYELILFNWTADEYLLYEKEMMEIMDHKAILENAKKETAEEKKLAVMHCKQKVALKLLKSGVADDIILKATDLSIDELENLKSVL